MCFVTSLVRDYLYITSAQAFLEVASIVRIEMNVNYVFMTVIARWVFNRLLALYD